MAPPPPPPPPSNVNLLSHPCIYGDFVSSNTERKSRVMKWLGKLFKTSSSSRGGGGGGSGGYNPHFLGEENMVVRAPAGMPHDRPRTKKEQEELDRAIALSLSEGRRKPNGYNEWRTGDNYGGALPRGADHGSMSSSGYPPYGSLQYSPIEYRVCAGCHGEIGYGNYVGCMGAYFHPKCFSCHSCGYPITEPEFSLAGRDPYHKTCFKELTHPKCDVCLQFIPTNEAGLIEYRCHPFWSQKYCPSHEHDNTARCCSCERLESWNLRYYSLEDGRSLCLECMESAIMDTGDCQPLYHAIRDYYEGMNMKLDQQIPMLLVERQALNEAIGGEKNIKEKYYSIVFNSLQISKRTRIRGCELIRMRRQPQKLTKKCEVTAILVLYGLPRLLTGAILTHELMHGWLRLKGYRNLNPQVEEGICQVLSYMWLESEVLLPGSSSIASTSAASSSSSSSKKGRRSNVENKLGEFFMNQIVNDASPAYGGGFRAANAAVNKYGLRITLDHMRLTGNFPL
ncbi:hypothetical protein DITRI_Ditri09bG0138800 [Diplodiscus trichospermus]